MNSVGWLGVANGKPRVELDHWSIQELEAPDMPYLDGRDVTFEVDVEGMMGDEVYLVIADDRQRKRWRFRYYPQSSNQIVFERCVVGARRDA